MDFKDLLKKNNLQSLAMAVFTAGYLYSQDHSKDFNWFNLVIAITIGAANWLFTWIGKQEAQRQAATTNTATTADSEVKE